MVGWQKVVDLAISAGMNDRILATPAAALGSYEVTPLEIAEAFTIFANQGIRVEPRIIRDVANGDGKVIFSSEISATEVLDPRVAYLMTNLMEGVINRGTGIRARFMGLRRPAAGKTGTSHDGWFAGYTSGLLCIIWVGFDDNRELMLEGASSALPIWTEFMKQAVKPSTLAGRGCIRTAGGRHGSGPYRRRDRTAGHARLSERHLRTLYRRFRADPALRPYRSRMALRPAPTEQSGRSHPGPSGTADTAPLEEDQPFQKNILEDFLMGNSARFSLRTQV